MARNTPEEMAEAAVERIYETSEGEPFVEQYHEDHGTDSMLILTVHSMYAARKEVERIRDRIAGKTVVEIGAGVGMLAIEMAKVAKRVYAIEVDPAWSWVFVKFLYELKPPNLTWIFGSAQELVDLVRADVAVVYTRSDRLGMHALARRMAPELVTGPNVDLLEAYPHYREVFKEHNLTEKIATELMARSMSRLGPRCSEIAKAAEKMARKRRRKS